MNIILSDIRHDINGLELVKPLYLEAFPAEERRLWTDLNELINDRQSAYNIYVIKCNGVFSGFLSWWNLGSFVYVEHFAVSAEKRGAGIGGQVLKLFIRKVGVPVVLEAELPQCGELAVRRIGFYKRNGFRECCDVDYVQPPYAPGLPSVPLRLMISNDADVNLVEVVKLIHRNVYNFA